MKINTKIVLKNIKGENLKNEDKDFTLGEALSNVVVNAKEGGKMKLYILGTKLYQEVEVEVDDADLNLLKSVVKSSEVYNALILGQCEMLLEEIKK